MAFASTTLGDLHLVGSASGAECLPLFVYDKEGERHDNITDWSLDQFRSHYCNDAIEKRDIFDYIYAVLHNPLYREKYALNLKAEFPHIPFYVDFKKWAGWGRKLINLHTGYSRMKGYPLIRINNDPNVNKPKQKNLSGIDTSGKQDVFGLAEQVAKSRLKADKAKGVIEIDAITKLEGIPSGAWEYSLGGRSALEWVMEEYRDFTPKDVTIREKFDLYRFADHKEDVIALLGKVCRVSIEVLAITNEMEGCGEA
jgi:predicted helicase